MTPPPSPWPEHSQRKVPTDTLYRLLLHPDRDWHGARERLRYHPRDAAYKHDGGGSTPLHAACRRRAPPALLKALMQAWPVALWTPDAAGWLPLHALLVHSGGGGGRTRRKRRPCAPSFAREAAPRRPLSAPTTTTTISSSRRAAPPCTWPAGTAPVCSVLAELLQQYPDAVRRHGVPCFPADLVWRQRERARRCRTTTTHNEDDDEDAAATRTRPVAAAMVLVNGGGARASHGGACR